MSHLERLPIQPGKPDPTIFRYTNKIASNGFTRERHDWINRKYWTDEGRRRAFMRHGKREMTAITSILIAGLDKTVASQMANRPYDGFVENINRLRPDLTPEYKPTDIFNSEHKIEIPDESNGRKIKLERRDTFFIALSNVMTDTFTVAFDEHLNNLMETAGKDPNGNLASLFKRFLQLRDFEKKIKTGGQSFKSLVRENIESGATQMAEVLKIIMLINQFKSSEEFIETAKNSYVLLSELAMMEGRVTRSLLFGQIMQGILYNPRPDDVQYFTIIHEEGRKRLDFSDRFKSIVLEIDRSEPNSRISERLACPAIRGVHSDDSEKTETHSVIRGMWDIYLKFAERIYSTFYSPKVQNKAID